MRVIFLRNYLVDSDFFRTFASRNNKTDKESNNMVKLNNSDEYESIGVIKLTKEKFPKAFKAKVEELLEEGVCETEEEAENVVKDIEFELEVYYEKGTGLFAVESEAVESGTIYSPYTAELCEDVDI